MSGEPEKCQSPSVREIAVQLQAVKDLMAERDLRYKDRFEAQESALLKYDANAEKWRAASNEWRAAMTDREQEFAGRTEMISKFEAVHTKIDSLLDTRNRQQGRSELSAPLLIAISGGVGGLAMHLIQQALK